MYVVAGRANRAEYLVLLASIRADPRRGPRQRGSPFLRDVIYPVASGSGREDSQGETQEADDDRFAVTEQTVCERSIKSTRERSGTGNEIMIRSR